MIINDLDGYYIVFDTKNWNTELDTLLTELLELLDWTTWVATLPLDLPNPDLLFW